MTISERIFEILRLKGISQRDLSAKTGIPASTISDWKGKKVNPASDKIMIICEVLEVSPYELLSGTESEKYTTLDYEMLSKGSEEYKVLQMFRKMNPEQKARVFGYMDALQEKLRK
jgi:transcriptional regulator with XRE-family HTH domain